MKFGHLYFQQSYFCFSFLETFHQDAQTEIVLVNLFQMFTEHGGDRATLN